MNLLPIWDHLRKQILSEKIGIVQQLIELLVRDILASKNHVLTYFYDLNNHPFEYVEILLFWFQLFLDKFPNFVPLRAI